jgi:hypothetical protein
MVIVQGQFDICRSGRQTSNWKQMLDTNDETIVKQKMVSNSLFFSFSWVSHENAETVRHQYETNHNYQISFSWVSHENEKTVRQQYETKTRFSNLILMGVP